MGRPGLVGGGTGRNDRVLPVSMQGGRHLRNLRVSVPQKHLKLMGGQGSRHLPFGPPVESALRQSLMAQPKTLSVIGEDPDGRTLPVCENEQASSQGVLWESVAAKGAEPVDSQTEIDGIDSQKNPHLRGDLDHGRHQRALARSMRFRSGAPLRLRRSRLPSGCSSSITHSE